MSNFAQEPDYTRYDIEFNSDRNCSVLQRTRVRWNENGTVTVFEWQRNPATMEGYGWRRYDVLNVVTDDGAVTMEYFAPAAYSVRCAAAVVRPWGSNVLEIQGVAERHTAVSEELAASSVTTTRQKNI